MNWFKKIFGSDSKVETAPTAKSYNEFVDSLNDGTEEDNEKYKDCDIERLGNGRHYPRYKSKYIFKNSDGSYSLYNDKLYCVYTNNVESAKDVLNKYLNSSSQSSTIIKL